MEFIVNMAFRSKSINRHTFSARETVCSLHSDYKNESEHGTKPRTWYVAKILSQRYLERS